MAFLEFHYVHYDLQLYQSCIYDKQITELYKYHL